MEFVLGGLNMLMVAIIVLTIGHYNGRLDTDSDNFAALGCVFAGPAAVGIVGYVIWMLFGFPNKPAFYIPIEIAVGLATILFPIWIGASSVPAGHKAKPGPTMGANGKPPKSVHPGSSIDASQLDADELLAFFQQPEEVRR